MEERATVKIVEIDYNGIANVLAQFVELYKVCENVKLLDDGLRSFITPTYVIRVPEV